MDEEQSYWPCLELALIAEVRILDLSDHIVKVLCDGPSTTFVPLHAS